MKGIGERREKFLEGMGVPESKPFSPDDFQLEAIEHLEAGCDTLVVAPTGAGKTYIAVQSIGAIAAKGGRSVYTAPLKALSNAKYTDFKERFEPEFSVGLLTGDRKIDVDSDIMVATTEIYRNHLFDSGSQFSLVVLDEFHYLADPQRGPVWEESIILSAQSSSLLMLSASVSNSDQIASWISEVRQKEVKVVRVKERPVALRLGFLHPKIGALPLASDRDHLEPAVLDFYSARNNMRPKGRGLKHKAGRRRRRK